MTMELLEENDNVLDKMAQLDFNLKINAEILEFDESEDQNLPTDQLSWLSDTICNDSHVQQIIHSQKDIDKNMNIYTDKLYAVNHNFDERQCHIDNYSDKESRRKIQTKPLSQQSPNFSIDTIDTIAQSFPQTHSREYDTIRDYLNTLSQYLMKVMESYFTYGVIKRNALSPPDEIKTAREIYQRILSHYVFLSHKTMEHIVLPQEKNTKFIASLIKHVVALANNNKIFTYTCEPRHVKPFLDHFIEVAKIKHRNPQFLEHNANHLRHKEGNTYKPQEANTNSHYIFSRAIPDQEVTISLIPETLCNGIPQSDHSSSNQFNHKTVYCKRPPPPSYPNHSYSGINYSSKSNVRRNSKYRCSPYNIPQTQIFHTNYHYHSNNEQNNIGLPNIPISNPMEQTLSESQMIMDLLNANSAC